MARPDSQLLPLGDFKPSDEWQTHVNAIFYGIKGPEIHNHFQTYVSRDYRLAHALADTFLKEVQEQGPGDGPITVQEWGVGNGNLAARFLSRLQAADTDQTVYPRIHYTLCDYSEEILNGVRANPNLQEHEGRYFLKPMNAETQDDFEPHSVHKIISNEIWDDLGDIRPAQKRRHAVRGIPATAAAAQHPERSYGNVCRTVHRKESGRAEKPAAVSGTDRVGTQFPTHRHFGLAVWRSDPESPEPAGGRNPVPINTGAFKTLAQAKQLLAENNRGYTSFDYGMLSDHELNWPGRPYYKLYGGQYTSMVNFPLIAEVAQAVGFADVQLEHQHDFVGRNLSENVLSALELVQVHPKISRMEPWDADLLMLQTLQALNASYRSPYKGKMDYPPMPGTPKKQRKQIAELAKNLSATGVPDTVAYITESEVTESTGRLKKLGYGERDLKNAFDRTNQPIAFGHMTLR